MLTPTTTTPRRVTTSTAAVSVVACLLLSCSLAGAFTVVREAARSSTPTSRSVVSRSNNNAFARTSSLPSLSRSSRSRNDHKNVWTTTLFMGWGPEPVWSAATVVSNDKACESEASVCLSVEVPEETASEYKFPGQYVQMRLNSGMDKPLFLAIASPPMSSEEEDGNSNKFEFLVKKTEGNEWLTSMTGKEKVEVSQVLGNGFPIKENLDGFKYDFPTQNILLFAAGSGLAPIKAAIESGQLGVGSDSGRTARLYYGERTPSDLCYVDKFAAWESMGYQVVPVLSQPELDRDGGESGAWQGRTGYIQNALEEDGIAIPRNSGALLCGMKGMTESVKDLLVKAGVFDGRVMFNF